MSCDHIACIALGANLGNPRAQLKSALEALAARPKIRVKRASSFIETEPVGGPPGQPTYLNAAAVLKTDLSARELLNELLAVEKELGRDRSSGVRNAPRLIDLDLLLYDDLIISEPGLEVPHPRMHERAFVLEPLAEIAPDFVHPILQKSIRELAIR